MDAMVLSVKNHSRGCGRGSRELMGGKQGQIQTENDGVQESRKVLVLRKVDQIPS